MDHEDSNDKNKSSKKSCRILERFLKINNRLNAPMSNEDGDERKDKARKSFRKSLRSLQTTVKNCMFPQRQKSSSLPVAVADAPSSSSVPELPEEEARVEPPEVPPRVFEVQNSRRIPDEVSSLATCCWYWGPMTTAEAEEVLKFKPDGTFLVRDSSSTSYLFSISFRSIGKTKHARIEYNRGKFSMYGSSLEGFPTVLELIQDALKISETGIYCYSRRGEYDCDLPVRLTKPISRYTQVRSLKFLARFVIRQCTTINDIPKLPLPTVLYDYLLEGCYF